MRSIGGIFVGGRSSRMGGRPKGLLTLDDQTLVARASELLERVGVTPVLVGRHAAYAGLDLPVIDDDPAGIGPIGGLAGLLKARGSPVIALACDMPFVTETLLRRLLDAPPAAICAPRRGDVWEPLCARYDPACVLPILENQLAARRHSLQGLLAACDAVALAPEPGDDLLLRDWDTPGDVLG